MDMSQIKYGEYAENFQFLSNISFFIIFHRLRGWQFLSERPYEDLHLVLLYNSLLTLNDSHA